MVRISEIQIDSSRLDEYKAILKEEAEASVRLEAGVICIFPMSQRENPSEVRILEIYASREAYESHLKTPHFERYKTMTLPMVQSLKLVDMQAIDPATMPAIFGRMRRIGNPRGFGADAMRHRGSARWRAQRHEEAAGTAPRPFRSCFCCPS